MKEKTTKEKEKGAAESSLVEAPELGEIDLCRVDRVPRNLGTLFATVRTSSLPVAIYLYL